MANAQKSEPELRHKDSSPKVKKGTRGFLLPKHFPLALRKKKNGIRFISAESFSDSPEVNFDDYSQHTGFHVYCLSISGVLACLPPFMEIVNTALEMKDLSAYHRLIAGRDYEARLLCTPEIRAEPDSKSLCLENAW
jgi:hypothetical protein